MSNYERENRDWSDALRDSLRDAEQMPSAELWDRIERSAHPVVYRRLAPLKWSMAVAAVLLLGFFAVNLMVPHATLDTIECIEDSAPIITHNESDYIIEPTQPEPIVDLGIKVKQTKVTLPNATPAPIPTSEPQEAEPNQPAQRADSTSERQQSEMTKEVESLDESTTQKTLQYFPPKRTKSERALAINISGGGSSNGTAARSSLSPHGILSPNGYKEVSLMELYDASDISHRQPLGFELTISHRIANKIDLVGGLNYTLLNSDLSISDNHSMLQRVQFIGIPLRLETPLWSNDNISLYVGAGGALEYCLTAKIDGESVDERRWHTSVGGVIGAQYNINRTIGVYFEPDLSYYFTPTQLITVRSESPLSFTMRFGLRFAL